MTWVEAQALICPIREAVFIEEQQVPVELEWDGLDEHCTHLLALSGDAALATARMTTDGKIGRMAVLKAWRGRGIGSQLMTVVIAAARDAQLARVELDAQLTAIPFYQRFGFEVTSVAFMDAGIAHQKMALSLQTV